MLFWKNACPSDKKTLEILLILFRKHPDLLYFLFVLDRPQLRLPSIVLKENSGVFSSGEELLVRLGLDIWDGSGQVLFKEIYQIPDPGNFNNILETLCYLRNFQDPKSADNENSPPPNHKPQLFSLEK